MKREIKFRIWDNNMKRWWCEDLQSIQMDGKKIHPSPLSTLEIELPSDRVCVEQYVNLKDKNGKDIYEGDILKSGELLNKKDFCVVEYEDIIYWIVESNLREVYNIQQLEIVGNIHENPELIDLTSTTS